MNSGRLYWRMALADVRSQMQHTASFVMLVVGNFLATIADFLAIWALFSSFGALGNWTLAEIAVLYGIINVSYALAQCIGRGFERFNSLIKQGDFDRLLLRPRGTAMQVLSSRLDLSRLGRGIRGAGVLVIGILGQPQGMGGDALALIALCIAGGVMLFVGMLMMQAAACFWTVESLEAFNVFTFGGVVMSSYPLEIYDKWLRNFFLYVIPIGFLNYLPCAVLFGKELPFPVFTAYLAPAAGAAFMMLGRAIWSLGVRHYRSTGA